MKKELRKLAVIGALLLATNYVGAHPNIVAKDNLDAFSGVKYREGSMSYVNMNIFDGCFDHDTNQVYTTNAVTTLFPNAESLSGIAFTMDPNGNIYNGNAFMRVKPRVDSDWKKIKVKTGAVPEFFIHGVFNEDARAIHWKGGEVPDSHYDNLEFVALMPMLQGCYTSLKVYLPTVQYCEGGHFTAYLKAPTPSFPEESLDHDLFVPYLEIARDLSTNPLPSQCSEGLVKELYPTEEDIENYLPTMRKVYWPNGVTH